MTLNPELYSERAMPVLSKLSIKSNARSDAKFRVITNSIGLILSEPSTRIEKSAFWHGKFNRSLRVKQRVVVGDVDGDVDGLVDGEVEGDVEGDVDGEVLRVDDGQSG